MSKSTPEVTKKNWRVLVPSIQARSHGNIYKFVVLFHANLCKLIVTEQLPL